MKKSVKRNRRAIVVLGMHRSGTSALAGVLKHIGVDLSNNLLPPNYDNITGFWEHRDLIHIHEKLLIDLNTSWDDVRYFPDNWWNLDFIESHRLNILGILERDFSESTMWGMKDPRMCRLLPLWRPILEKFESEPFFIIIVRNPLEVIASLKKRNGFSAGKSSLLWLIYLIDAEKNTRDASRILITYDDFLSDWIGVIHRIEKTFGYTWPLKLDEVKSKVEKFLDSNLRHYRIEDKIILESKGLPKWIRKAYRAVKVGIDKDNNYLMNTLDDLSFRLNDIAKLYEPVISDFWHRNRQFYKETEERIGNLQTELNIRDERIRNIDLKVHEALNELSEKSIHTNQLQSNIDALVNELSEKDVHINQLQSNINAILKSRSWKMTAPLRWIYLNIREFRYKTMPVLFFFNRQYREIKKSGLFDSEYYLNVNPDVAKSGVDPLIHYMAFGTNEGRNPNPLFDTAYYLRLYRDVAESGMNPLAHYARFGIREGRIPHPEKGIGRHIRYSRNINSQIKRDDLKTVDIVICIHNALEDLRECLSNLSRSTQSLYNLILVDDGSLPETGDYVKRFSKIHKIKHIRNMEATGYAAAAAKGMKVSTADLVILLNEDTLPTRGWVDKVLECANSDKKIGIVGVLSSTASWQSVPTLLGSDGDWALNPIPNDLTLSVFASILEQEFKGFYPKLPFINGFCYAIKKKVIEDIGFFDYQGFPNYGEENDYCLRARANGWQFAVAADAYVYHKQGKSYTNGRRLILAKKADEELSQKHDKQLIANLSWACRNSLLMHGCRMWTTMAVEKYRIIKNGLRMFGGFRISFILPAVDGGGVAVILQEAFAMAKMGVAVEILNLQDFRESFLASNNINPDDTPLKFLFFETKEALLGYLQQSARYIDAVICTYHPTVHWLTEIDREEFNFTIGYYIQDFEPYFFPEGSKDYTYAKRSYKLFEDMRCITKTKWNCSILSKKTGCSAETIGPSVNLDIFRPLKEKNYFRENERINVAGMVRPSSPRRAPEFTYRVLRTLSESFPDKINAYSFGCSHNSLKACVGSLSGRVRHIGLLNRKEMSSFLNECDIFLDLSEFQAMGLTALEAMACGCAVVVPQNGGCIDFCDNGHNAVIVDSYDFDEIIKLVSELINDFGKREMLQFNAIEEASKHFPEKAALNFLQLLFE